MHSSARTLPATRGGNAPKKPGEGELAQKGRRASVSKGKQTLFPLENQKEKAKDTDPRTGATLRQ